MRGNKRLIYDEEEQKEDFKDPPGVLLRSASADDTIAVLDGSANLEEERHHVECTGGAQVASQGRHQRQHRPTQPGAVRVSDLDTSETDGTVIWRMGDESRAPESIAPVSACLVEDEEENRRDAHREFRQFMDNIVVAEVVETEQHGCIKCDGKRKILCIILGTLIVVVITVAVTAAIFIPRRSTLEFSSPTSTPAPTVASTPESTPGPASTSTPASTRGPTTTPTPASTVPPTLPSTQAPSSPPPTPPSVSLAELLASVSLDGGVALQTPSTPQNEAFLWLSNNTNLAKLYYSTNGESWENNTNWLDNGEECNRWYQFEPWKYEPSTLNCTSSGALESLDLFSNNVQGLLPPEIGLLSDSLVHLNFGLNSMSGEIFEISKLTRLTFLNLRTNELSGPIPSHMGLLTALTALGLWKNDFTGTLPSEIGLWTALTYLNLRTNEVTGPLPSELGRMTELIELSLLDNRFTGTIPTEIKQLTNLEVLRMYDNMLTGDFTCPDFISTCLISCNSDEDDSCRSL